MQHLGSGWIDFGRGISVQIHAKGAHWRVIDARHESQRNGEVTEVRLVVPPAQITGMIFPTIEEAVESVKAWLDVYGACSASTVVTASAASPTHARPRSPRLSS